MFVKFIICASLVIVQSAKILIVVPTTSISHQVVFRPLIQELINRDNELTVLTTDPVYSKGNSSKNLYEIDLHDLSYDLWNNVLSNLSNDDQTDMFSFLKMAYAKGSEVFEKQLEDKSVQQLIKDKTIKFDLLIIEGCFTPALIFTHIFKAPVIQFSSFGPSPGSMEAIGAATHPFLYPWHYRQRIYNLTIWEKINELYNHFALDMIFEQQELQDDKMLQRLFGTDTPPLGVLKNNVHMVFLNIHPIWIHNQPVPSNVVYTWGIHKPPEKILPQDLQSFLDYSENGVIYISFGTNFRSSSIPPETLQIFLKVFSRLPYNILWKWDLDELPGKSEKIKISKWFPQYDVLRHPKLKLFITQGGLQSTDEALKAGVPLIGLPVKADQKYNTEKYVHFKIGIQLNFKSLTEERLENAIKTILLNESYRQNVIHLNTLMHDQPKHSLENAIWWIEYVLRHGGARHLRTPAANMSWTIYYELELVLIILGVLMTLVTILIFLVNAALKYMLRIIFLKICKIKMS